MNPNQEKDIIKSVFSIRDKEFRMEGRRGGYFSPEEHRGFAVAISPRHLLTAFHCVSDDSDSYLFTQPEQNIRIEGDFQVVHSDEDVDLAVVELSEALKFYSPVVPPQKKPRFSDPLLLINHFGGVPQRQPVSKCYFTIQDLDYIPNYYVRSYKMPVKAVGGYSGSPIFTQDGTVVSLATEVNKKRQDKVIARSAFIEALGFSSLDIPFEAVDPKFVARFIQKFEKLKTYP